jgi:mono/diheme cytochrome c family protein
MAHAPVLCNCGSHEQLQQLRIQPAKENLCVNCMKRHILHARHGRRIDCPPVAVWAATRMALVLVVVGLVLTGCGGLLTPAPADVGTGRERERTLVQPLSWEEVYRATPIVGVRSLTAETALPTAELDAETLIQAGEALYLVNCAPCHRVNGEGNLNRFPALNHNALVTAQSPQELIRVVLYGRGVMPAFDATLTDTEVAATLSYIRNAWSNDAAVIRPADVQQVEPLPLETPDAAGAQ